MESQKFGQKQQIHIAIRQLIHDYPQDEGILKELIQNADDGGASEVRFILDRTRHPQANGPAEEWQMFTQPSLIVVNDRPFSPEDLENIQDLGDSDKVNRPNQTGRYGRGFNSVYNLTDTPLLLTGATVSLFDPCGFQVESPGSAWKLSDLDWQGCYAGALDIFGPGGYKTGTDNHNGTVFRFPFRTQLLGEDRKHRITDELFPPESFYRLVDGLAKIADVLLLYLRNVTSIRCYEIGPNGGKPVSLMEIVTENTETVRQGRRAVTIPFDGLKRIEEILERLESLPAEKVESVYEHRVSVTRPGNPDQIYHWVVCSGLFAGQENRLTALARRLNGVGNKAVPFAGAAICLSRNGKPLPLTQGGVSCTLPLAAVLSGASVPLSMNGAFDLDGSRTGITKHSGGEVGERELRADWNVALIEEGIVPAIVAAMTRVPVGDEDGILRLYRLIAKMKDVTNEPFGAFSEMLFRAVAEQPIFSNASGESVKLEALRAIPNDPHLQAALAMEGLPIPCPALPTLLIEGFANAGVEMEDLDADSVREAYFCENSVSWELESIGIRSLREPGHVQAVTRFLVDHGCDDFCSLPLASCADGFLRSFPVSEEQPLYIGSNRQKEIFGSFPEWFLDDDFCLSTGLLNVQASGFAEMTLDEVGRKLSRVVFNESGESCWDPNGEDSPNAPWLIRVLDEILEKCDCLGDEETKAIFLAAPLVPGDDQELHQGGLLQTPLLVSNTEASLVDLLVALGIRHWILRPGSLTERLVKLRDHGEIVWSLTPDDLVDSLSGCIEKLEQQAGKWRSKKTVERLLEFFGRRDLSLTNLRRDALRRLPIWKDADGAYGSVDDHCYFAGEFQSPGSSSGFRILPKETQGKILEQLGIEEITRRQLLESYIMPVLGELEDLEFVQVVRWIRAEWDRLADEFESGEAELVELLEARELVIDSQGKRSRVSGLYTIDAAEIAMGVLGDGVRTPSRDYYSTESGQWGRFFESLRILSSPSAQHLTVYIESMTSACEGKRPTPSEERLLVEVLKHVRAGFESLADQDVESEELGSVEFADFLAETVWMPAFRPTDALARFGAWKEPGERLFKPKELIHPNLGARAASVRPLSPSGVVEFSQEARHRLGIVRLPSPAETCAHLRNIVERVDGEVLGETTCREIQKPLEAVYRGLHDLERDGEKLGYTTEELSEACCEVAEIPCILHPTQGRLMRPRDVYEGEASGMSPFKVALRWGDPEVDQGISLLGRLERPGVEDLAAMLRDFSEEGRYFLNAELAALLVCVNRLVRLIEDCDCEKIPLFGLPNAEGTLKDLSVLVWDDDPALSQQLDLSKEWLLHPEVNGLASRLLGIAALSSARAVPIGELVKSADAGLVYECQRIQQLLRSSEFRSGMARLLLQDGRAYRSAELRWLADVRVTANHRVACTYRIESQSGHPMEMGSAEAEVAFVDFDDHCEFLVSEEAQQEGLLIDHFCRELIRQLGDMAPSKDGHVLRLLGAAPQDIDSILDRLHVPREATVFDNQGLDDDVIVIGAQDSQGEGTGEDAELELEGDEQKDEPDTVHSRTSTVPAGSNEGDQDGSESTGTDEDADEDTRPGSQQPNGTGKRSTGSGDGGNGGQRTGGQPGRMTKGSESTQQEARRIQSNRRQQDGLWISRPKTERQAAEARENDDTHNDEDESGVNLAIGDAAVGWVLQYERKQGRKPMSMAHANPGYDVESKKGRIVERYIEVKGIDGEWGQNGVPLSAIQMLRSQQPEDGANPGSLPMGDKFWLYVVEHARDPQNIRIHMIQNPAAKAAQFRFDHGWRHAAETVEDFSPVIPRKGLKLLRGDDDEGYEEGEILMVQEGDKATWLEVRFDSSPAKRFTYDPTRHELIE